MTAVQLVAVFAENKPGQTARITEILAEARVNILWVTIASTGPFGVMKFLVDKPGEALACLKEKGVMASLLEVLAVEVPNRPGALHGVAACLAKRKINLDNTSGVTANNRAVLLIETQEIAEARKVMAGEKLRLLTPADLQKL